MGRASISASLPTSQLAKIDEMVDDGEFEDRSAVLEAAVGNLLAEKGQ